MKLSNFPLAVRQVLFLQKFKLTLSLCRCAFVRKAFYGAHHKLSFIFKIIEKPVYPRKRRQIRSVLNKFDVRYLFQLFVRRKQKSEPRSELSGFFPSSISFRSITADMFLLLKPNAPWDARNSSVFEVSVLKSMPTPYHFGRR